MPLYGTLMEKTYTKHLDNTDMLRELRFYDALKYCKNIKSI